MKRAAAALLSAFTIASALMANADARSRPVPVEAVPFVGCPSDGALRRQPAPKSGPTPRVRKDQAMQLAYYSMKEPRGSLGVLAPRGWHCFGLYELAGGVLLISPGALETVHSVNGTTFTIRGPVVEARFSDERMPEYYHEQSMYDHDRGLEAECYFPQSSDFFPQSSDISGGMEESEPSSGPYEFHHTFPDDIIKRRTDTYIRYTTPANKFGQGTFCKLDIDTHYPVEGAMILFKNRDEPNLLGVNTRLPSELQGLTEIILSSVVFTPK